MREDNLKVYINKLHSGNLSFEDEKYVFNYLQDSKDVVSLTMPIRSS
ncbi:MAG: HipA N-terminal domain-containing protein, partial [Campylobacterales bacterium]